MTHSLLRQIAAAAIIAGLGMTPAAGQTLLDKARDAVRDAGETIEDAARDAGRDASDFLADNPDLNRDILDLGQRMGLPGFDDAKPYAGANLTAAPAEAGAGAGVMLTAAGLPGNAEVKIGFGPAGGDFATIATAVTTDRGTLDQPITIPAEARPGETVVFTAETADGRVRLISEAVTIVAPGPPPGTRISIDGTLSSEGTECPALRGDDGKLYTLADPSTGGFKPGDRVHVEGEVAGMSRCMQGITLTATTIAAADG